jgi:hypothetical protein
MPLTNSNFQKGVKIMKKQILYAVGLVVLATTTTCYPVLATGLGDSDMQLPSDWADQLKRTAADIPSAVSNWQAEEARKKAELDRSPEDAYVYDPSCERRRVNVLNGMAKVIEEPSQETQNYRGSSGDTKHPLGLRIDLFVFPFVYKSGYEKEAPKQQAAFAYDLVRFQDSKGIGRPEIADADHYKTLRYRAYENFAVAWWYANSPSFKALNEEQRKTWAFEALMDGVLIYDRYLAENNIGHGDLYTHLEVFEQQLGMAHIKHDENHAIGG